MQGTITTGEGRERGRYWLMVPGKKLGMYWRFGPDEGFATKLEVINAWRIHTNSPTTAASRGTTTVADAASSG
jgi:hypothetical protein